MKIRKDDNVIMIAGKDKGKKGKVINVFGGQGGSRIVIEGLNMIKRHQKARKQGQKGQIVSKERAVDPSAVQLICSKCGKVTRVGFKEEGSNKIRICRKCEAEI